VASRRPSAPRRPASRPGARSTARSGARTTARSRSTGATRTASNATKPPRRPSGPARDERRRSRLGLVLPEVLTVRLLVLGVVLMLSFVLLLPTVRGAVQQQAEIDRLEAELSAHRAELSELEDELARWDDRTYVVQQARSRLNYVLPGDTAWRVVDGDAVSDGGTTATDDAPQPVATGTPAVPWYQGMWESVQVTDEVGADAVGEPDRDASDVDGAADEGEDGGE